MCNVAQGTVLGPTLVNSCVNYLAGNLAINHFICTDDVKLTAPPLSETKRLLSKSPVA